MQWRGVWANSKKIYVLIRSQQQLWPACLLGMALRFFCTTRIPTQQHHGFASTHLCFTHLYLPPPFSLSLSLWFSLTCLLWLRNSSESSGVEKQQEEVCWGCEEPREQHCQASFHIIIYSTWTSPRRELGQAHLWCKLWGTQSTNPKTVSYFWISHTLNIYITLSIYLSMYRMLLISEISAWFTLLLEVMNYIIIICFKMHAW